MKLQKLIIKNFRGLKGEQNVIDFSNSNIIFLIGQNNVGKSSFLRAYEFFVASRQNACIEDFYNYDISNPIEIEGVFLKEADDEYDEELKGKEKAPDWLNKWTDNKSLIRIKKIWGNHGENFKKYTFNPNSEINDWVVNGFGGLDTLFTKYAPTPIAINAMENQVTLEEKVNKLMQDDFLKKIKENYQDKYTNLVEGIKELQGLITGSEAVEALNNNLNENFCKVFNGLTLRIQSVKDENIKLEDAFKKNHSITVEREDCLRKETFLQNGHGLIRQALFNFLAFLKKESSTNAKQYLILFEEPELFLHPKIAFNLRESLYSLAQNSPYQILCATHSPLMIDISRPHSSLIKVVKKRDETTQTFQVGEDLFGRDEEMKNRVQMINRFNPHICESFYADKVLLVEGDTEAIVYRDLLSRFFPNEEIFVLNTGSKMNIPFFQEILTAFRIEHYVIHDTDRQISKGGSNSSAWTMNDRIWSWIEKANNITQGLARRYVHERNFEFAHKVTQPINGKPLNAYLFVKEINLDTDCPCLNWLKDIIGKKEILHDQTYINSLNLN